jgi:hypothetical protein
MAAETVMAGVTERAPRSAMRIVFFLSTAALAAAAFAGCASIGSTGARSPNASEGGDRLVWDCGWRALP